MIPDPVPQPARALAMSQLVYARFFWCCCSLGPPSFSGVFHGPSYIRRQNELWSHFQVILNASSPCSPSTPPPIGDVTCFSTDLRPAKDQDPPYQQVPNQQ